MRDPFQVLGIPRGSTAEEIKKAYRQKAREHHPDRAGDEERMKEVNIAYERALEMTEDGAPGAPPSAEALDEFAESVVGAAQNFLWEKVVDKTRNLGRFKSPARTAASATLDAGREILMAKLRNRKRT